MAARRLLIIMLVLLGISSVIAIVVPKPERDDSPPPEVAATTGTTGTTGTTEAAKGATGATGRSGENGTRTVARPAGKGLVYRSVDLDAKQPEEIELESGTRVVLTVSSKDGSELEIEGLGLAGFADPYAPAYFDVLLPEEPGTFRVSAPREDPAAIITTR